MAKKHSSNEEVPLNLYSGILLRIFRNHYRPNVEEFEFERSELEEAASHLKIILPKNLGDLLYSFRFRAALPSEIVATASGNREWVIELAGRARYRFALRKINRISPNPSALRIKIPDATPEIVAAHTQGDEQALLAKVRYNRLIDIFLRVTAYSLQNHLRTSVKGIGQMEVDEVYVAVTNTGQQFVVPVQAKGRNDKIGATQIYQDIALCRKVFPHLTARPVAVQFVREEIGEIIVMFELVEADGDIRVADEKHYRLVPAADIAPDVPH